MGALRNFRRGGGVSPKKSPDKEKKIAERSSHGEKGPP